MTGRSIPHSSDLVVLRVVPEDWEELRATRLEALRESPEAFSSTAAREEAFNEEEWRRRAARPASFLALRDGTVVGLAGVFDLDGTWTVASMWIAPQARGTGVVDALIGACEAVVREAGASQVRLGVMEDNVRGRRAYERLGYRTTGVRHGRHELEMVKTLA